MEEQEIRALRARIASLDRQMHSDHARNAAEARWARADKEARSAQGRIGFQGLQAKFVREIDPDGTLPPEELAARLKNRNSEHFSKMSRNKGKKERDRLQRELKAALRATRKKKAAGSSVAADGPASETATTTSVSTGQESQ